MIHGSEYYDSPVVKVSCSRRFFDEAKPACDMLNQHSQENHQPEGPEGTKSKVKPLLHHLFWADGTISDKSITVKMMLLLMENGSRCQVFRKHESSLNSISTKMHFGVIQHREVRCDAHHMLHRIWKRIRFCPCSTGMKMRKTVTRRQRKNTMVWMIMPAGERSELQGLQHEIYTLHRLSVPISQ